MKRIVFLVSLFVTSSFIAQNSLPSGWDKVIMDGKEAYININTGEIVNYRPKGAARAKAAVKSYTQDYSSSSTSYNTSSGDTHRVQQGETLSSISRKYNTSLGNLKDLNPSINFGKLAVGQQINIGGNTTVSNFGSGDYHTVTTGQTLYRIAKQYGMGVTELKSLNNLTSNSIRIGQRLRVN